MADFLQKAKGFLFTNSSTKQTIAKNAAWLTIGQVGSRLFRALIIIYAARVLGAAEYGVFSYVVGLAGFFTVFADIGVGQILTRSVSQKPKEAHRYFATAFWIKAGLLIATSLLIILVAPYFSKIEAAKPLIPLVALLMFFDNLREFSAAYFRGKEKMELEALLIVATNVAITVFGFIILFISSTAEALTLTYILSAGTGTVVGIILLRKQFARLYKDFTRSLVKPILKSAIPIAFTSIFGVFMINVDIIMLGALRSAEDVGLYSASQKIVQLLYMLPSILAVSTFPAISRFIEKGEKEKTRTLLEQALSAIFFIAIPLVIGGVVLGQDIIQFLYGAEYLPGVLAFQILVFTPILLYPGMIISNFILAHDKQIKFLVPVIIGSLSNVLFNALLIPPFGITGSAVATIGAQLIYNGSIWVIAKRIQAFSVLQRLPKITLASVLMGLLAFLLHTVGVHVLITIGLCILLYFGILYALREDVLQQIRHAVRL